MPAHYYYWEIYGDCERVKVVGRRVDSDSSSIEKVGKERQPNTPFFILCRDRFTHDLLARGYRCHTFCHGNLITKSLPALLCPDSGAGEPAATFTYARIIIKRTTYVQQAGC
jgi:hypothetical protein